MAIFLSAFTLFNLFAGLAACAVGARLLTGEERARWASRRLYAIALALCWGVGFTALTGTAAAWLLVEHGWDQGAPLVLAPIAWLLLTGVIFAIVDFAEDGVFDFGRGAKPPATKNPGTS
ncbi:MAG: hypothetical protein AB7M12_09720 [Hyphomonadaceae bacterium]